MLHIPSPTLPETNIAPENGWLEDEMSFLEGLFSGMFACCQFCLFVWLDVPGC